MFNLSEDFAVKRKGKHVKAGTAAKRKVTHFRFLLLTSNEHKSWVKSELIPHRTWLISEKITITSVETTLASL